MIYNTLPSQRETRALIAGGSGLLTPAEVDERYTIETLVLIALWAMALEIDRGAKE